MQMRWKKAVGLTLVLMGTLSVAQADPTVHIQKAPASAPTQAPPPQTTVPETQAPTPALPPQQTARATIQVVANVAENDRLGQAIVKKVMQRVSQSPRFQVVARPEDAGLILHLVTISPDPKNQLTAYGETYTIAPHGTRPEQYVYSTVTVCGEARVNDCAGNVEQEMEHVLDMVQHAWEQHELLQHPQPRTNPPIEV